MRHKAFKIQEIYAEFMINIYIKWNRVNKIVINQVKDMNIYLSCLMKITENIRLEILTYVVYEHVDRSLYFISIVST